ncbi:MAG: hypothetical protein D4R65_06665 [Verrucomicrobiaceae bacterium]|nr:MAG: hypothetical protein D4R65_06665 [Verrucomicrobiaceae bacterium]
MSAAIPACKDKNAVQVYRVSKAETESSAPPKAAAPESSGMGAMPPDHPAIGAPASAMAPAAEPSRVTGNPPSNWVAQPLTTMRMASYLVKGENGTSSDISLVALAGPAGGVLDNVNRWLSQLGKPAITAEQLAQMAQHVASPLGDVTLVDIEGLPEGADAAKEGRIIAGIAPVDGKSFFFKMRGNAPLAESQKDGFIQWIGSVRMNETASAPDPMAAAPAAPLPSMPSAAPAVPAAPEPQKEQIKWEVPAGWNAGAAAAMRYASFAVAGQNGEKADISVSVFGGDGGGDLGNVNRWRSQIGLGEVADGELKSLVVPVAGKDSEILTVDMTGPKGRILAGWARIGGRSWFFKLIAPDQLAGSEKAGFQKFLESVQFQP